MQGPVLMVRGGALGDFVLTLPVVAALLDARLVVDIIANPRFFPLLPSGVRSCLDINSAKNAWVFSGKSPFDHRSAVCFSPIVEKSLQAAGLQVYASPPMPDGPASAFFARAIAPVPVNPVPKLILPTQERNPKLVVIAPGSGGQEKRWPIAFWQQVALGLSDYEAVWVGGPLEEAEPWAMVRPGIWELALLAGRCGCWLGPDSGPSHVAAAAGARVGVVFSTTDPRIWAPAGAKVFGREATPEELVEWVKGSEEMTHDAP